MRRDFDTLTPEVGIRVRGQELPLAAMADLIAVSVLEDVDASSTFSFRLLSWDGVKMEARWIDDDLFMEGNPVEVRMGYRDQLEPLCQGEITGLEPEFVHSDPPTLTVRGYDRRHRLRQGRKTRSFRNMKDSDIANDICAKANLTPDIQDSGLILGYVLQHNQTDLEFLLERAHRIGFEVVVSDRTLYFGPRRNQKPDVLTLSPGVELLEFYPILNILDQVDEIQVRGWDPKGKEEFVGRAMARPRLMKGDRSGVDAMQRSFGSRGGVAVDVPTESQAEADSLAKGWFAEMALNYIRGHGLCIGQPKIRAGTVVKIEGLGKRFSGDYYVTSAEHSYKPGSGYRTAFSVRRNSS